MTFNTNGALDSVNPEYIELKDGVPEDPDLLERQERLISRLE
jgi:hypothetical protein